MSTLIDYAARYSYGRYVHWLDQRCRRCGCYLVDHDPIGCPDARCTDGSTEPEDRV